MSLARHLPAIALLCVLYGCGRETWVDVDASGCNEARIRVMNRDAELVRQMGAVCALDGKAAAANRLRCHGRTLQVACRE